MEQDRMLPAVQVDASLADWLLTFLAGDIEYSWMFTFIGPVLLALVTTDHYDISSRMTLAAMETLAEPITGASCRLIDSARSW